MTHHIYEWQQIHRIDMVPYLWRSARQVVCRALCLEGAHPQLLSAVNKYQRKLCCVRDAGEKDNFLRK